MHYSEMYGVSAGGEDSALQSTEMHYSEMQGVCVAPDGGLGQRQEKRRRGEQ